MGVFMVWYEQASAGTAEIRRKQRGDPGSLEDIDSPQTSLLTYVMDLLFQL